MLDLLTNQIFLTVGGAWLIAHVLKFFLRLVREENVSIKDFFESGGFPSGHTTLVTTAFVFVGLKYGWTHEATMLAALIAIIVIYDAMNIRYRAGQHAAVLNKMNKVSGNKYFAKPLKENLGHTYVEVLGGIVLAIIISFMSYYLL